MLSRESTERIYPGLATGSRKATTLDHGIGHTFGAHVATPIPAGIDEAAGRVSLERQSHEIVRKSTSRDTEVGGIERVARGDR